MHENNLPKILVTLQSVIVDLDSSGTMDVHWSEEAQRVELNDLTSATVHGFMEAVDNRSILSGDYIEKHSTGEASDPEMNWSFSHELWGTTGDYWVRTIISIPIFDIPAIIMLLQEFTKRENNPKK